MAYIKNLVCLSEFGVPSLDIQCLHQNISMQAQREHWLPAVNLCNEKAGDCVPSAATWRAIGIGQTLTRGWMSCLMRRDSLPRLRMLADNLIVYILNSGRLPQVPGACWKHTMSRTEKEEIKGLTLGTSVTWGSFSTSLNFTVSYLLVRLQWQSEWRMSPTGSHIWVFDFRFMTFEEMVEF